MECFAARHVVVVRPARAGHHHDRGSDVHPQRRVGRGLQPQAAGALMTLRVNDLKVYYQTLRGDVHALDGVTFDLADGEIMGLAGESGCGKTTLGKSLIRLDTRMRHVGGSIELNGKDVHIAVVKVRWSLHTLEITHTPI